MKVLVLGVTGNVGSRMVPALIAHKHQVVAYVRTPSKMSAEATSKVDSVVVGSASDSASIKAAILAHGCDAVVNAAGMAAMTSLTAQGEFPAIFAAVVQAAVEAGKERGGPPLRCWFLSGWSLLDAPKKPYMIMDYVPLYPSHKKNYDVIKRFMPDVLAWSLFCASNMVPKHPTPQFLPTTDASGNNLVVNADHPPALAETYLSVPLIGGYLNLLTQATDYYTTLEDCVDFMAADLEKGLESQWIGKRVGAKEKPKSE